MRIVPLVVIVKEVTITLILTIPPLPIPPVPQITQTMAAAMVVMVLNQDPLPEPLLVTKAIPAVNNPRQMKPRHAAT